MSYLTIADLRRLAQSLEEATSLEAAPVKVDFVFDNADVSADWNGDEDALVLSLD